MTQTTLAARRSPSRFDGQPLSAFFGPTVDGRFNDEVWNLNRHPQMSGAQSRGTVYFDGLPLAVRDSLKELLILASHPAVHASPLDPSLAGVKPRKIATITRWLGGLAIDLQWLIERSPEHSLKSVRQNDLDAWLEATSPDHRRTSALKSYARYQTAMSPDVDRLVIEPWPGRSGLDVAGGFPEERDGNTTPLFDTSDMAPWLQTAMLLIDNGRHLTDAAAVRGSAAFLSDSQGQPVQVLFEQDTQLNRNRMFRFVAGACAFATVAFTGMRASEFDAVPRDESLDSIAIRGAQRWLLTSYLSKGLEQPRKESWLVPPVVRDAVEVMHHLLDARGIPADTVYAPTERAPLFDRRALSTFDKDPGTKAVMRLSRAIEAVRDAIDHFHSLGLVAPRSELVPNGRQLRRNLTIAVASRPHGAQAAMEQFKWQRAETAAGYFRVAPEAVALGQREVYEEVAELHRDLVADALHDEFVAWEERVAAGDVTLPTGPDGRRKRDMFAAVQNQLPSRPRVEEDNRRLRTLLRTQADSMHLTDFGWCDWDESQARCGGIGGPAPSRCQPDVCLNHSTPSTALAAHRVRSERLLTIANDRSFPPLAREKARVGADAIAKHLGPHLEDNQ